MKRARDEGEKKKKKKGAGEGIEQPNGRKGRKTGLWSGAGGAMEGTSAAALLSEAIICCDML